MLAFKAERSWASGEGGLPARQCRQAWQPRRTAEARLLQRHDRLSKPTHGLHTPSWLKKPDMHLQ